MFVCHCRAVTDRQINDAIANGARSVEEVSAATGAGTVCGGCIPEIERLCTKTSIGIDLYQEVA